VRLRGRRFSLNVRAEWTAGLSTIPGVIERLKALGVVELVSASRSAAPAAQGKNAKAQLVQPGYAVDGSPICPEHDINWSQAGCPSQSAHEVLYYAQRRAWPMSKGRKRPPAPALAEQDIAHLHWMQRNSTDLVRSALELYRKRGRGAFIVKEEEAKPSGTAARYLTVTAVQTTESRWPDVKTAELVRTYDPAQQFVIVFLYHGGAASSYTIHFVEVDDMFTVEVA
jgi:hypothetical protein